MGRGARPEAAWNRFERIQSWKDRHTSTINGINYARVVATYLYRANVRHLAKMAVYGAFFRSSISRPPESSRPTVIFYAHRHKSRPDYDYIIDYLADAAGPDGDYLEHRDRLSPTQIIRSSRSFKAARRVARGFEVGALERFALTVLIARFISERPVFEPVVEGRAVIVTFSDALPWDNFVAQLGKVMGARTITAQHGQYRLLGPENVTADAEAYVNFVSDTMLVWGQATVDEFEKAGIARERLAVVGWIRSWPESPGTPKTQREVFGVILNGENGHRSNYELMRVAEELAIELGMKYVARAHPTYARGDYLNDAPNCVEMRTFATGEYATRVQFSVASASSAALEMLLLDQFIYVFDDGTVADVFRQPGLVFDSSTLIPQVRRDLSRPKSASTSLAARRAWYNDATDQHARVVAAMARDDGR